MPFQTTRRFQIDPDPPIAGMPARVTYNGPSTAVEYQVDGGRRVRKNIPPRTFDIDPVPSGFVLFLVDETDTLEGGATYLIEHLDRDKR